MDPTRRGNYLPVQQERQLEHLAVLGTLPPGLRGTLFRNGPNPRFPADDQHWFLGDGMVHAFSFGDPGSAGGVSYRNRWVRTERWHAEGRAGHALSSRPGGRSSDTATDANADREAPRGVANTNILQHAGHLLALEEGHAPAGLDPATLDTLGKITLPVGDGPFTAHPKRDPETGALWFFGARSEGVVSRAIRLGAVAADGRMLMQARIEAPYPALVHDFAVTSHHIVIPLFPLVPDLPRAAAGGPWLQWEPGRGAFLGVMRRDDPAATLRWLAVDSCFSFHVMNAWEDADSLSIDLMQCDKPSLFPDAEGRRVAGPTTLWRWRIDLSRPDAPVERRQLSTLPGEFPQIDLRTTGFRHRHGFFAATTHDTELDTICHRDEHTGREALFVAPAGDTLSEPVFVPRAPDAGEGDGWLLAVQYRAAEDRSDLVILDTDAVESGPIATVQLPCRVPNGFHGSFVGAAS
ncbi:carotenoid oxygenase family protein [Lichenicola sp.]|uniref:carotenoid oxygenase family protein n=1 Tax=Lichenicola sp. TaxID=2804529 RepID=UPI003B001755